MARKKDQDVEEGQTSDQQPEVGNEETAAAPSTLSPHRYVGKTIKHFDHLGKLYQLVPNTVCLNLPAEAEQVKRLIANNELVTI